MPHEDGEAAGLSCNHERQPPHIAGVCTCMVFMPWCGWSPVIRLHMTTAKLYTCAAQGLAALSQHRWLYSYVAFSGEMCYAGHTR